MTQPITVTLTSEQWAEIDTLINRGLDDLAETPLCLGNELAEKMVEAERLINGDAAHSLNRQISDAKAKQPWSTWESKVAKSEGWCLHEHHVDKGLPPYWCISRETTNSVFDFDLNAVKHVMKKSAEGSPLHCRAIALHMTYAGK